MLAAKVPHHVERCYTEKFVHVVPTSEDDVEDNSAITTNLKSNPGGSLPFTQRDWFIDHVRLNVMQMSRQSRGDGDQPEIFRLDGEEMQRWAFHIRG